MSKKIYALTILMLMAFFSFSQEASKVAMGAGSSQTTTATNAVSGWVGNKVAFVDANSVEKSTGIADNFDFNASRLDNLDANLFPNPVVDHSVLTVKGINQEYVLRIFDNQGKNITPNNIAGKAFKQNSMEISFSSLPVGYLLVDIQTKDGKSGKTIKVLKTNN